MQISKLKTISDVVFATTNKTYFILFANNSMNNSLHKCTLRANCIIYIETFDSTGVGTAEGRMECRIGSWNCCEGEPATCVSPSIYNISHTLQLDISKIKF